MPAHFDQLTRRYLPSESQIDLWVDSQTGSDALAGTQAAPLATTEEALARIPLHLWGRRVVIHYVQGHTETINRPLIFPPISGSDYLDDVSVSAAEPSWDYIRPQIMLQCEPVTVQNITGTLSTDATCSQTTVTVAGAGWTTNEHVGRMIINPGLPAEHAVIWGNSATQLFTTSAGFSDGTLRIVEPGATLNIGDASAFVNVGMMINGFRASLEIVGLKLVSNPGAGHVVDMINLSSSGFLLCELDGGFMLRSGAGFVSFDACYLHDGTFAPNGQPLAVRQCFLQACPANYHGSGGAGLYDIFSCRIDGCGPMGHGGASLPEGGYQIDQCWIINATSYGVIYSGGNKARVKNTRIDSSVSDAIRADGAGSLFVQNVTGTANGGYGCFIDRGANVEPSSTLTVAGALGEVRLGNAITYTWSQTPQVSASRLCRF